MWYIDQFFSWLTKQAGQEVSDSFRKDYQKVLTGEYQAWEIICEDDEGGPICKFFHLLHPKLLGDPESDAKVELYVGYRDPDVLHGEVITTVIPSLKVSIISELFWELACDSSEDDPIPEEFAIKLAKLAEDYFVTISDPGPFYTYKWEFGNFEKEHIFVKPIYDPEKRIIGYNKYLPTSL